MGAAAVLMACSVLASRCMGLLRDKVISYYHGAGAEADIYFAAFVVPDFINYLLAGGYFSITLIPLLVQRFAAGDREGWSFFSTVFSWAALASALLCLLAWLFAPELAGMAAPGFSPAAVKRLAFFLRIMVPAQIFFLPGACCIALLYWRRQFAAPALVPLVYNGCILLGGLLMQMGAPHRGMEGFAWGVLAGAALGSFCLPLFVARAGGLSLRFSLTDSALARFILLALPLMLGQSIVVLDEQLIRVAGSLAGEGSVSLLSYARRIMQVPVGVVAQAAGVASYPFLAQLAAEGRMEEFAATISATLRHSLLLVIPLCAWMASCSVAVMRLIFQQGRFSAPEADLAGILLAVMLLSVVFWTIQQLFGRAFYAHENTLTPALAGSFVTVISLPLYWLFALRMGALGVACAGVVAIGGYAALLAYLWIRRHGHSCITGICGLAGTAAVISALPGGMGYVVCAWIRSSMPDAPLAGAALAIAASGVAFGISYALLAWYCAPKILEPIAPLVERAQRRFLG